MSQPKRQRAGALQDLAEYSSTLSVAKRLGLRSRYRFSPRGHVMAKRRRFIERNGNRAGGLFLGVVAGGEAAVAEGEGRED